MATIFLVHGTGVRRQAYDDLFGLLDRRFAARGLDIVLRTCFWGDKYGARLHHGGRSIPGVAATLTRAIDEDGDLELWARLYDDPAYELHAATLLGSKANAFSPDAAAIDFVVERMRLWTPSAATAACAASAGIGDDLTQAWDAVLNDSALQQALASGMEGEAMADLLARAIVAFALATCAAGGRVPLAAIDADLRDDVVSSIAADLKDEESGVEHRVLKSLVTAPVTDLISRAGTFYVRLSRDDVFRDATPVAGDIVLYQAKGEPIRRFIADAIADTPRPIVLLTHSLGGVASFDLLAMAARAGRPLPVDLLVTVGSQAPFLYEIGAACSLAPDEPLPDGFPGWLNVFSPRDFLSYKAADLFPGRVTDVEVTMRQPFPRSHSAYWACDTFWNALEQAVGAL